MKETPLLFSSDMARATVENRKRLTRRLNGLNEINWKPDEWRLHDLSVDPLIDFERGPRVMKGLIATFEHVEYGDIFRNVRCLWGQVGDWIWGRETWKTEARYDGLKPSLVPKGSNVMYLADGAGSVNNMGYPFGRVRQSIFMPRWASRIERELVGIRMERLQAISRADCVAEGLPPTMRNDSEQDIRVRFRKLWDSINAKRWYPFDLNPWVWVLEFPEIKP